MEHLPSSIEAYLTEAGFSGTEILILNKLLGEDALTIRELAAKTGKSTGVLDQAMKKMLKKGIITRETINETPKYILHSLQSVSDWVKDDTRQKQQMIARKFENFEAFLSTLKKGKQRPEMEYFEGREGVKRAYLQLLERGRIFLRYGPTLYTAEEDPLRDFYVQYFRERKHRDIFCREITHETVLGRRYKSRDPFEYRQTILVDQERYPFTFDKIIAGDTVACFQLKEERACFIRYTELAEDERAFFERLWQKKLQAEEERNAQQNAQKQGSSLPVIIVDAIPVRTRIFSKLRDFFLGRRGLIGLSACVLLASALTVLFYSLMANANLQKIREQVKSVAATGALQFDSADLDELHSKADITKPQYAKVVGQLNAIRNQNPDITYAYILRPLKEADAFEYVADADSLNLDAVFDLNKDGKIDSMDAMIAPGRKYFPPDDVLKSGTYNDKTPTASATPTTDEWGTYINGSAPIYDKNGKVNAILGIDKRPSDIHAGLNIHNILIFFIVSFFFFMVIWLGAFDRFVLTEICEYMEKQRTISAQVLKFFFSKRSLIATALCAIFATVITYGLYYNDTSFNLKRIQDKVLSIAATGALQFAPKDLDQLHSVADIHKPEYAKVIYLLNAIRKQNEGVKYMYIMRPTEKNGIWEFVADADSLDPYAKKDLNDDGKIDAADHLTPPGEIYDAKKFAIDLYNKALIQPIVSAPSHDQWGDIVSGWAPIKNSSGTTIGVLGVDKFANDAYGLTNNTFQPICYFICIFVLFFAIRLAAFNRSLFKEICDYIEKQKTISAELLKFFFSKKSLLAFCLCALLAGVVTFGLYMQNANASLQRIREEVKRIAATGSIQFDINDLNLIRIKDDIHKPEYAKIISQLNQIRDQNSDVKYIYILRPISQKNDFEFVADADSINPDALFDINGDGKIDSADENITPGRLYDGNEIDVLRNHDQLPAASIAPYTDQWGTFITGLAPIYDKDGKVNAILGVDKWAKDINGLTAQTFHSLYYFLSLLFIFILIRLFVFNLSLCKEICKSIKVQKTILIIGTAALMSIAITFGIYEYTQILNLHRMQDKVVAIASTAAPQFNSQDIDALQVEEDWKKPEWSKVVNQLKKIRSENTDVTFVYIFRKSNTDPMKTEFVSDSHSLNPFANTDNDITNDVDADGNKKIEPEGGDKLQWPGQAYPSVPLEGFDAYNGPIATRKFYTDQWGKVISGYAPIKDGHGNVIAILAVDMHATKLNVFTSQVFIPIYVFIIFFILFILMFTLTFDKSLLYRLFHPFKN